MLQRILTTGFKGSDVREIQSLLNETGYYAGTADGVFGELTSEAVKKFQNHYNIQADGIIGPETYNKLCKYLNGYDTYTVKPGNTLFNIAKEYNTDLEGIFTANPGLNPLNILPGTEIIVPCGAQAVRCDIDYTYEIMERNIQSLKVMYPFLEWGTAGKSILGRELYYIRLGSGANEVFYNAAHHANEWITSMLLMRFAENFCKAYSSGSTIRSYNIRNVWKRSSIYIMPMVNPDGVDIVIDGISSGNPYYSRVIEWNGGNMDLSRWSANIRGVDINHNYDAAWEISKKRETIYGIHGPCYRRYSGPSAESEPETKAVVSFTRKHNFKLALSYHSQGRVIYWTHNDNFSLEEKRIGEMFSKISGYTLSEPDKAASYSGYKDWFIKEYKRPCYNIQAGRGKNPLPVREFESIYNDNIEMLLLASII